MEEISHTKNFKCSLLMVFLYFCTILNFYATNCLIFENY